MANMSLGSFQKQFTLETKEQVEKPGGVPGSDNPSINSVVVRALPGNTGTVYLGGPTVTAATGFPLAKGDSVNVDIQGLGELWGFATAANDKVAVLWAGP